MSERHPIIAITGSSGAGTSSVTRTFENIFRREKVTAAVIEGDSFHRFDRKEMRSRQAEAEADGNKNFSHFGPENNLFPELEQLFRSYSECGQGRRRRYLHDPVEAAPYKQEPGTFTPWEELPADTDMLFYEGLHAAVHGENPDILAMCHAHTVYGTAYAALGRPLPPVTQDACAFFEDHAVITKEAGQVAVEERAGRSVCSYFKDVKAVIHQSHGLFTSSRHSIDAAAFWFIALERCCQQQLAIDATGHPPSLVPPDKARYSREHVGSDYIGWLHFQPIFEQLRATQPDMFD